MPTLPFYQIDAFASKAFEGNQACVMTLDTFLDDSVLQAIAAENNVAETAFIVAKAPGVWALRWFTPAVEVPLCGHATLASAYALFAHLGFEGGEIAFDTVRSGRLTVQRLLDGRLEMDFPCGPVTEIEIDEDVVAALGARPVRAWGGMFYAAEFASVDELHALSPDHTALKNLGAPGEGWDRGNFGCFVRGGDSVDVTSRFFAPGSGINEDPATGSWHTMLARILADVHAVTKLTCFQAYPGRGAEIETEVSGERVKLRGRAVTTISGQFHL